MFDVKLTNGSSAELETSNGKKVSPNGGTWTFAGGPQGQATYIDGPFGRLGFLDIGDQHVPGDSGETWGVLITYLGVAMVGRYEGQGSLAMTVDPFLRVTLSGMDFRQVELEGLLTS